MLGRLAAGGQGTGRRLLAFGLWNAWPDPVDGKIPCAAIDPLAHRVAGELNDNEARSLAARAAGPLRSHWGNKALPDAAAHELLRLGTLGQETGCILAGGTQALSRLYRDDKCPEAVRWGTAALAALEDEKVPSPPMLLRWTADACVRIGETDMARRHYQRAIEVGAQSPDQCTPFDRASILLSSARLTVNDGAPDDALETLQEARELLGGEQHVRERAITLGDIARIKVSKGLVDDALKLHEEMIAVFEALGDQRSRAVTLFDMAQIALSRQQHQRAFEALAESFRIAGGLGDASGIANVGAVLGQLLLAAGDREQGLAVLGRSRDAFSLLGQADAIRQLEGLIGGD